MLDQTKFTYIEGYESVLVPFPDQYSLELVCLVYLLVMSDRKFVWGTSDNSMVVVWVPPTTVPLAEEGGAGKREIEDLTFIIFGCCVNNQLERALKVQACCVRERERERKWKHRRERRKGKEKEEGKGRGRGEVKMGDEYKRGRR